MVLLGPLGLTRSALQVQIDAPKSQLIPALAGPMTQRGSRCGLALLGHREGMEGEARGRATLGRLPTQEQGAAPGSAASPQGRLRSTGWAGAGTALQVEEKPAAEARGGGGASCVRALAASSAGKPSCPRQGV